MIEGEQEKNTGVPTIATHEGRKAIHTPTPRAANERYEAALKRIAAIERVCWRDHLAETCCVRVNIGSASLIAAIALVEGSAPANPIEARDELRAACWEIGVQNQTSYRIMADTIDVSSEMLRLYLRDSIVSVVALTNLDYARQC